MNCKDIERIVWTDGPELAPEDHLAECKSCREEARHAGDLRAALRGLQNRFAAVPPDLEHALLAAANRSRLDWAKDVVAHPKFWRGAAVGAAAAAAAATAAYGLIAVRRSGARAEVA